jgi:hypothetical protein
MATKIPTWVTGATLGWHTGAVASSDGQTAAFIHWLDVRTADLLSPRWPAVEAVAKALIARRTLTGKELAEVIRSVDLRRAV